MFWRRRMLSAKLARTSNPLRSDPATHSRSVARSSSFDQQALSLGANRSRWLLSRMTLERSATRRSIDLQNS